MSLSAGAGLESQVAELGGVLAARLQAKIASVSDVLNEKVEEVRSEFGKGRPLTQDRDLGAACTSRETKAAYRRNESADFRGGVEDLQVLVKKEAEKIMETARDDIRTVHLEVMSVDTRIAAVEEHLRHGPARSLTSMSRRSRSIGAFESGISPRMRTGGISSVVE